MRYEIIVFDSTGKGSQQREYLERQKKAGNIKLITREEKTSHNDAMQILFDGSDSEWVCFLHSDIEVLEPGWLYDLLKGMRGPKDLGIGQLRSAILTCSLHWSAPIFHTMCILLNRELYSLIRTPYDWAETFIDMAELKNYFCPEIFRVLPPPKHDKIFCEAGSKFAETVLFYNPNLTMHVFDEKFFNERFKHYASISHPEHDIDGKAGQELKRAAIHEALMELRNGENILNS